MEKRVEISIMLDLYGILLTDKQRDVMDLYFNNDLSLAEISEDTSTSRQAIHDIIKRCEKLLNEYESKLHLMKKSMDMQKIKKKINKNLDTLVENDVIREEFIDIVNEIKNDINDVN